jgi:DNA gyrase subunit A
MVSAKPVTGEEDIMIITVSGVLIRMPVSSISTTGRNTQGVILIRIQENEAVATVARIDKEQEEEIEAVSDDMLEEPVVSETDDTEEV